MVNGLLGKKLGMTTVFEENGNVIPVTVLKIGPCKIVQIKSDKPDGYKAVQLSYVEQTKKSRMKKPQDGHFKKADISYHKYIKEFKIVDETNIKMGAQISVDIFESVKAVNISGVTKGKGFAGVMKRYGFKGFPASRGTHESFRGGGSIGQCADPGRVFKGKKMAGHMGNRRATVKNLEVVRVDKEKNMMFVRGAVPGPCGSLVEIKKAERTIGNALIS